MIMHDVTLKFHFTKTLLSLIKHILRIQYFYSKRSNICGSLCAPDEDK